MWYQIQEMIRSEKSMHDEQVMEELHAYNPLIPEPGQLSATLFIELTSEEQMREWLPKLVGIESSMLIKLSDGTQVTFASSSHQNKWNSLQPVVRSWCAITLHMAKALNCLLSPLPNCSPTFARKVRL